MVAGHLVEVFGDRVLQCKAFWPSSSSWLHCDVQNIPAYGAKLGKPSSFQQRLSPSLMLTCWSL